MAKNTKSSKDSKGKKAVSRVATPRSEKISKLAKVTSGVTKTSALTFNLDITYHSAQDIYGILAEESPTQVLLKCRPKSGSSKEGYLHINKSDIIILEGALGKSTRINFMRDTVVKHKNVQVKLLDNGAMLVRSEDGNTFTINQHPAIRTSLVAAEVEGAGDAKKKKKKKSK